MEFARSLPTCRVPVAILVAVLAALGAPVQAADLPDHAPLRILIVSDEVNPHGLPDNELTQPGDISAALLDPNSGLNLDPAPDGVLEIPTDSIAQAATALSLPSSDPNAYDVLVYFAHRDAANPADQAAFDAALETWVQQGGGMVSFHHGSYFDAGKLGVLEIIGGTASGSVPYDTVDGQNVINVAPHHFVTTYGVEYSGSVAYADPARGVPAASYGFFNNTPDERYPTFELNPGAGQTRVLFASNYADGGTTHLLGFIHQRANWAGRVVVYQPGEYQPNALDDLDGNGFQILANSILFASGAVQAHEVPALPTLAWFALVAGLGIAILSGRARRASP